MRTPYLTEFREQLVALARIGRSFEGLAWDYEPGAATNHDEVKQASADDAERDPSRVCCQIDVVPLGSVTN